MEKINHLTVIEDLGVVLYKSGKGNVSKRHRAKVKCDCGKIKEVDLHQLRTRKHVSCGCMKKNFLKHGLRHSKLYGVFDGMKKRCYNSSAKGYDRYGGRGIKICEEWLNDFNSFYSWGLNNGYRQGLQIDRIDNDGDYEPENCRFTLPKTNANNRNNTRVIEWNNISKPLSVWADELDISRITLSTRLFILKWSVERAFTEKPKDENGKLRKEVYLEFNNEKKTLKDWAKITKINSETIRRRIFKYNWTVEKALTKKPQ